MPCNYDKSFLIYIYVIAVGAQYNITDFIKRKEEMTNE